MRCKLLGYFISATILINTHATLGLVFASVLTTVPVTKVALHIRRRREERLNERGVL